MKKTIYLLNIDNYSPEITAITYPLIELWARKIGAEIVKITERKFPDWPTVYEKLQLYEIEKERQSDWIIFVDSDCLIHPEFFDITAHLPAHTVFQNGHDFAPNRVTMDDYFHRDGRYIGTCNWFTVVPKSCLDFFKPIHDEMTLEEASARLFPTPAEAHLKGMKPGHLIDDFVLSRNLSRYGLKYMNMPELLETVNQKDAWYLAHQYLISEEEKVKYLSEVKKAWLEPERK